MKEKQQLSSLAHFQKWVTAAGAGAVHGANPGWLHLFVLKIIEFS